MRNLPLKFDYSTYSQKLGEDFQNIEGVPKISSKNWSRPELENLKSLTIDPFGSISLIKGHLF